MECDDSGRRTGSLGLACELHDFPWVLIRAELLQLAMQEAPRIRVPRGSTEDAAQEACAKLVQIGVRDLPPQLLGPDRGRWLRLVVRNVLLRMSRQDQRWREAPGLAAAAVDPNDPPPGIPAFDEYLDLSGLPQAEWRVIALLRMSLTLAEIAAHELIDPGEVTRRARWGGLRLHFPEGRRALHVGLLPGSLIRFHGERRREIAALLLRQGWTLRGAAAEFGTTSESLRKTIWRGADHANLPRT